MDYNSHIPKDGDVFALSGRLGHTRAELVYTPGKDGAEKRVAWRLYDRFGRGVLLTDNELQNLCKLMSNFVKNGDN